MAYKSTYVVDSDADDEFERIGFTSQAMIQDLSPTASDEFNSPEHTPTTFTRSQSGGSHASPTSLITEWTSTQCADYVRSLGLGQYADAMIDESINGEALVAIHHEDLKDMGMASVGHRLTILKGVYDIKMKQNIPFDQDHYVPLSAEADSKEMNATQEDIGRIIDSIRLRDQRIIAAESELRAIKEDLIRLIDENRKLREETLPIIRMAKDRSHPLPNPEQPMTTPPGDLKMDKMNVGSGLSRKYSTKRLNLGAAPKNTSPTLQDLSLLDPSAAAIAAPNHLTTNMASQPSPGSTQQLSPTSPAYSIASSAITPRHFPRSNPDSGSTDSYITTYSTPLSTGGLSGSTLHVPSMVSDSASTAPSRRERDRDRDREKRGGGGGSSGGGDSDNIEIFKSFRVSIEDPCHKVLPVALKRYNINDDWRQYALYIVHGDQERCLGLEEKPLMLFKQLDKEGRKPMFMLRKHASPAGEGWSGPGPGAGAEVRGLPGGVL